MTEFGMVTQVTEKHISSGQPRPHPKGRDPVVPKLLGLPTYAQMVSPRAIIFRMITYVGHRSVFLGGQPCTLAS